KEISVRDLCVYEKRENEKNGEASVDVDGIDINTEVYICIRGTTEAEVHKRDLSIQKGAFIPFVDLLGMTLYGVQPRIGMQEICVLL
ncbi:MAG: hypothetical protein ACRCUU_05315, partial [Plesiomonas sp.]